MKCDCCGSKSFQHSSIHYACNRCGIPHRTHHEPIEYCPECKQSDLYMINAILYECLNCRLGCGFTTPEYNRKLASLINRYDWAHYRYPIDFEELCREAFKPSRVMYQLDLEQNMVT